MITIRPGSHVHRLLQLLSTAGEIPTSALSILGSDRSLSDLIRKLESVQDIRFDKDGHVYHIRLIQVSGRKGRRTVRLYKKGLPILDGLYPGLLGWYMEAFRDHCFSNDLFHVERNHRVAEAVALFIAAGIEARPYALPSLQKSGFNCKIPDTPSFYIARHFKRISDDETSKTAYTRIVGALFYPGGVYAVYNTRGAVMKWSGRGEVKSKGNLQELARMNAGLGEVSAALLLGHSPEVALATILESDKSLRPDLRFDRIYTRIHFIPLDQNGVRLLKILTIPDWKEKLLCALFENHQRSYDRGVMEYDAIVGNSIILSHLDGDIARLIRFREALTGQNLSYEIISFPWQTGFLRSYLGMGAGIRELGMDEVEAALGI